MGRLEKRMNSNHINKLHSYLRKEKYIQVIVFILLSKVKSLIWWILIHY